MWLRTHRNRIAAIAVVLAVAGASWFLLGKHSINSLNSPRANLIKVWAWCVPALLLVFLITAETSRPVAYGPIFKAWRWVGQRAYGIYLLHPWVHYISFRLAGYKNPELSETHGYLPSIAALVLTAVLANLSFRFLEQPFIRLGHRLSYRPRPKAACPA